jgi:hypothetical protein
MTTTYQGCSGMDFKFRNSEYSEEIEKSEYGIRNGQNLGIFGIGIGIPEHPCYIQINIKYNDDE